MPALDLGPITSTCDDQLPAVPVPAVRHRPGADDAVAARGPVPEPAPAARAAHRRGARRGSPRSDGRGTRAGGAAARRRRRASHRRRADDGRADDRRPHAPRRHEAVRRPGRRQRHRLHDPARARSSASSARTAPARRRSSTSSPGSTTRPPARIEFRGEPMIARPRRAWLEPVLWIVPAGRASPLIASSSSASGDPDDRRSSGIVAIVVALLVASCSSASSGRLVLPALLTRLGHLPERPAERHGRRRARPDVPEHPPLPEHDRARERPRRACTRGCKTTLVDALLSHAARPARGGDVARPGRASCSRSSG